MGAVIGALAVLAALAGCSAVRAVAVIVRVLYNECATGLYCGRSFRLSAITETGGRYETERAEEL